MGWHDKLATGNAVLDVFRDVRAMRREIGDFKARRGIDDGQ
jgi:hypothetical protein